MSPLAKLKKHLKPGRVYRRSELAQWSNTIDAHLKELLREGVLQRIYRGLYACPKKTSFGNALPEDAKLVEAFLDTSNFLLFSFNDYNSLGVGTTQLYNEQIVYNRKRSGKYRLENRVFSFRIKQQYPRKITREYLLVDLVNNIQSLAEDESLVLKNIQKVNNTLDQIEVRKVVRRYGSLRAKKVFEAFN